MLFRWISFSIALLFTTGAFVGCGPECPEGQAKCGEVCVNTSVDRNHCGACDKKCGDGELCSDGKCALTCQDDLTECEGVCANTRSDSNHCGGCGNKCNAGESCVDSKCTRSCPKGQEDCNGACVDISTDTAHCGECGKACDPGQICQVGQCTLSCADGLSECSNACVNRQSDPLNCGACDTKCDAGYVCSQGKCDKQCQTGLTDCTGACVDLKTDTRHCGKCGDACQASERCVDGKCELNCQDGYTNCSDTCIDTKNDRANCGACGTACATGELCKDGKCTIDCQQGKTLCDGKCTDVQSNPSHCGACGTKCNAGEACQSGKCTLYCQPNYSDCSGSCIDLQQDNDNCGACGTKCNTGEICAQGKCETPCPSGSRPCNNACIDYSSDPANCGRCGNACAGGEVCLNGQCNTCSDCPQTLQKGGAFNSEYAYGVAADKSGNIYVTGTFSTIAKFGNTTLNSNGGTDIFIAKMTNTGRYVWAVNAGGSSTDYGYAIDVDSAGNVYVAGAFQSTATFGATKLTSKGGYDIFVARLDKDGKWVWVKGYGSSSSDYGRGLAVDSKDNVYATGYFYSTVAFGSTSLTSKGSADIFLGKWDKDGKEQWAGSAGSSSSDYGYAVAVDSNDNVYLTGRFYSTISWGTTSITSAGSSDAFVAKFDATGAIQWATGGGGTSTDYGYGVAADASGNAYVTGYIASSGGDFGATKLTSNGGNDAFVAKVDSTGKWAWAHNFGSSSSDYGWGVGVDSTGRVFATGYFYNTTQFGKLAQESKGSADVYLVQIDAAGKVVGALRAGGTGTDYGYDLVIDGNDNIYIAGAFNSEADFGSNSLLSLGGYDAFVARYNKPGVLCPNKFSVCNGVCIDTQNDSVNCGACGTLCPAGEFCGGGKCFPPPTGLVIQEVNVGNPDYFIVKNTSAKDQNLAGVEVVMYDSSFTSPDMKFTFPSQILKAGGTITVVESSPQTGELKCSSIPYTSGSDFYTLMCFGPCKSTTGTNVFDALQVDAPSASLPTGITFVPNGTPNMTSSQESSGMSYSRVANMGKTPTFQASDWSIKAGTR